MFKIYVDSRLRKQTKAALYEKKFIFWVRKDVLATESDPADAISEILSKNSLEPKDVAVFEAFPGPGSYTGLKMGFSAVNVLKWVFGGTPAHKLPLPKYGSEPNITPPKAEKGV